MKIDQNMILILAALGVGGFLFYQYTQKGKVTTGGAGLSPGDLAIMKALQDQQAAAGANQAAMLKIIQEAKNSGDSEKEMNPWTHPDTIVKFAELGVSVAGMFV